MENYFFKMSEHCLKLICNGIYLHYKGKQTKQNRKLFLSLLSIAGEFEIVKITEDLYDAAVEVINALLAHYCIHKK